MKLLKELPHYEASLMMQIRTGAILTREKTGRMGLRDDDHCECGAQETLWHSWECELQPMVPPDLVAYARLPPARSVACLLPYPASSEECVTWKKACARARHIISRLNFRNTVGGRPIAHAENSRGHVVVTDATGNHCYCARCFTSRRIKDRAWLYTFDCTGSGSGFVEGDVTVMNTDRCKLVMGRWKSNALRPQWSCLSCQKLRMSIYWIIEDVQEEGVRTSSILCLSCAALLGGFLIPPLVSLWPYLGVLVFALLLVVGSGPGGGECVGGVCVCV